MAKILCAYSGIMFTCEHFPITLTAREATHPIFQVQQKKLLSFLAKWSGHELTPTDSYLLFLSLLSSSDHVEFRVPVVRHLQTDSIVANNMESLARTVIKLNSVTNPHVVFPRFAVTPDTKKLDNIHHWIEAWDQAYRDFLDGYKDVGTSQKLVRREAALERLIKNPFKEVQTYASALADWAEDASPDWPRDKTGIYWKEIITKCTTSVGIYSIPMKHIEELLEHCELDIPAGTIFSHKLKDVLRTALKKQKEFLGIGPTTFQIIDEDDTVEVANLSAIIQKAPSEEPKISEYPTKLAYLKAQLAWKLAQRQQRNISGEIK